MSFVVNLKHKWGKCTYYWKSLHVNGWILHLSF